MKNKQILGILPRGMRPDVQQAVANFEKLKEIRMRVGQPVILQYGKQEILLKEKERQNIHVLSKSELEEFIEYISKYSLYAFEEEMRQGFLTVEGGHRVGIVGRAIMEKGEVKNLKYISSVNIRVAHEVIGCADRAFPWITKNQQLYHTLILSPPGCGKTTILRDMIRQISDGNRYVKARTVGVVDERSEIAASCHGMLQNHLGMRTDVLDGCPKAEGMIMMIRSMRPQVLAVDEIGKQEDIQAILYAMHCGCKMLATIHGASLQELQKKPDIGKMIREQRFERYVVLKGCGEIAEIYDQNGSALL